jgi:hypothetical protein
MVEVNLIPAKLFHTIITIDLHYNMHTFTIFALIINTPNSIVHLNTKFMVISYNHNLYFRIRCRKIQIQDYNSFHYILIFQKIHTTTWIWKSLQKFILFYFTKNSIKITTKFHILLKMKLKQQNKIYSISKQNMWFFTTKYL